MSRAVRKPGTDPENVLDVVSEVHNELVAGTSDLIAFREMWYYLREKQTADAEELKEVGWTASDGLQSAYETRGEWWQRTADPIFRMLPAVIPPSEAPASTRLLSRVSGLGPGRSRGGTWRYDESGRDWPSPPAEKASLPDDVLHDLLKTADLPGRNPRETVRCLVPLREMYRHLEEHGSASKEELKSHFDQSNTNHVPEQGLFRSADEFFRDVGRPVLGELPGVAPPRTIGDEWRFIGVDANTAEELSE